MLDVFRCNICEELFVVSRDGLCSSCRELLKLLNAGHSLHCAERLIWGDGLCECSIKTRKPLTLAREKLRELNEIINQREENDRK